MAVRPLIHPPYIGRHRVAMTMGFSGLNGLPFPSNLNWLIANGTAPVNLPDLWAKLPQDMQAEAAQYSFNNYTQIPGAPSGYRARVLFNTAMNPTAKYKTLANMQITGMYFQLIDPNGAMATTVPAMSTVDLLGLLQGLVFKNKKTGFAVISDTFMKLIKDPAVWKTLAVGVGAPLLVSAVVAPAIASVAAPAALPAAFTATPEALTASYYGGAALAPAAASAPIITGLSTAAAAAAPVTATASLPAAFTATPQALTSSYYGGATLAPAAAGAPIVTGLTSTLPSAAINAASTAVKAAPSIASTITGAGTALVPVAATAAQIAPLFSSGGTPSAAPTDSSAQAAAPAPGSGLPSWGLPAILAGGALLLAYLNM